MLVKIPVYVFVTKAGVGPCGKLARVKKTTKHSHTQTYTDRCMHTLTHSLTDAGTNAHTHSQMHAHMLTLTHRCMHTLTY